MDPPGEESAAVLPENHKSEVVSNMESYTFRYLFFLHEKSILDALIALEPRDGDSLERFFNVDFNEE